MKNSPKIKNPTYKGIVDLEKDIKNNSNIKKMFAKVNNQKDAINLAQKLGYTVSQKEIDNNTELAESMLESIAGGKNRVEVKNYGFSSNSTAAGDSSRIETRVTWDAKK